MRLLSVVLWLLLSWPLQANSEPVILSVYGDIQLNGQQHNKLDFTLSELQALPQAESTTSHPWSAEKHHFKGIDMNALLALLFENSEVKKLSLEALNGFSVDVDWNKVSAFSPILAWQDNDKIMSRRNKGPLWLILPFDKVPKIKQADFLHYMVWQLRVIRVHTG